MSPARLAIDALRERIRSRQPVVGAAVGSGMTAMAAEEGGADLLMVLNAGYFRLQGCGSMAALMPYADANRLTWEIATHHILPRLRGTPVFLGTCAQDPGLILHDHLERVRQFGLAGVTNFPSVGFIDGRYREALEEAGLGYAREVALVSAARRAGLLSIAFCFTPEEARAMAEAGADILNIDLGFAEWRDLGSDAHQEALDRAVVHVSRILDAVEPVRPRPLPVVYGGPVLLPRDSALVYQRTGALGYIGGSTVERFPAAPLIRQTVQEFRQAALDAAGERRGGRAAPERLGALVGAGTAMRRVFDTIRRVAETDVPVLITGESGTGKELAAREIHRLSRRRHRPMVCWNCGALTDSLAMSELFGHERGAFTGATGRHLGKFEQADNATLFMDEVAELPLPVQASLLRVLQEREIVRVGGEGTVSVNVRLIAATNRDLRTLVNEGRFRLDLLYRLNTIVLRLPPLRERREDIAPLVRELAREFGQRHGVPAPSIPRAVMDALTAHAWPGNVRELRNAVERCVILGGGEPFRTEWLDDLFAAAAPGEGPGTRRPRAQADRQTLLREALARNNGNKAAAARDLGVTRKTLYAWLRKG
jgi:two-component system, NtrC family, response regulator AtoC